MCTLADQPPWPTCCRCVRARFCPGLWALQVLTKKYERAINQKVEAEEASLQAQMDVTQLIKLCEFCELGMSVEGLMQCP